MDIINTFVAVTLTTIITECYILKSKSFCLTKVPVSRRKR